MKRQYLFQSYLYLALLLLSGCRSDDPPASAEPVRIEPPPVNPHLTEPDPWQLLAESEAAFQGLQTITFRQTSDSSIGNTHQLYHQTCYLERPTRSYCLMDTTLVRGQTHLDNHRQELLQIGRHYWQQKAAGAWEQLPPDDEGQPALSEERMGVYLRRYIAELGAVEEIRPEGKALYQLGFTVNVAAYYQQILEERAAADFVQRIDAMSGTGIIWIGKDDLLIQRVTT